MPIVALSLWATGGATSFLQPVMIFTALFISYFFPPRLAWPLMALFVYAYATPLFYDTERALALGYPARARDVRARGGRLDGRHPVPEGPPRSRRAPPADMAEIDPLTGVRNRRGFDAALARPAATREPYALILIDLDDFKRVNDEEGHPAGDAVLRSVAVAAASVARKGDCVARIGGDEFALLAPGAGASGVLRLLRDLREAIEHPATFAAGLVPDDARTPEELMAHADARLLAQKRDGKLRQPLLTARAPTLDQPSSVRPPALGLPSCSVRAWVAAAVARVRAGAAAAPAAAAVHPIGDGAWSWFGDPRAVTHTGAHTRTYVGWVDQEGDIKVSSYDHATGQRVTAVLQARLNQDDHANPSIQVRPDGRLVVYYSRHVGPGDALPRVLAARGRHRLGPAADGADEHAGHPRLHLPEPDPPRRGGRAPTCSGAAATTTRPSRSRTTAGRPGRPARTLITMPGERPYAKYDSSGGDTIHVAYTNAASRPSSATSTSTTRACAAAGSSGRAASRSARSTTRSRRPRATSSTTGPSRPGSTTSPRTRRGARCIVFASFPSATDHRYHYARWTGSAWDVHQITPGGRLVPARTAARRDYSGGMTLDHEDPSRVYLSRQVGTGLGRWRRGPPPTAAPPGRPRC